MFTSDPEVSVIVSFYNIEECVDRCVGSLLKQSYKSVELILVDDGSTDNTSKRLDSYTKLQQVRVFHKPNGGLSDARNYGVQRARGRYIVFVDGDDVVAPHYIEALSEAVANESNVLAIGQFRPISDKTTDEAWWDESPAGIISIDDTKAALEKLLYEKITASALAKMGPRDLYLKHPFPVGVFYEEICTAAEHISAVDKVVLLNERIYGYVMRPGSITHRKVASLQQALDLYNAVNTLEGVCRRYLPDDTNAFCFHRVLQASRLLRLLRVVKKSPESEMLQQRALNEVRRNVKRVVADQKVGNAYKVRFEILSVCPEAYHILYSIYEYAKVKMGTR